MTRARQARRYRALPLNVRRLLADAALLVVVAAWGYTFVPVKRVTALWPGHWMTFVALRFWIATLAFVPLLLVWRTPRARGPSLRAGLGPGVAMLLGYAFQTAGLASTTASVAAFITSLSVVFVPLGARLLGHRLSLAALLGVAIAVPGLALICLTREEAAPGTAPAAAAAAHWVGEFLVLLCAVAFSAQILLTDRAARAVDPLWFTASQCLVTAVGASVYALVFEVRQGGWPAPHADVWFAVWFCGLLASTLAFTVQTVAQRVTPPTHVAVLFALEPVFTAIFAHGLAGERLTPTMRAGAALILLGTACSEFGARIASFFSPRPTRAN